MNDIERAIEALKMENELMQFFNPMTGEIEPIELQNQDNQDLYKANLVAISALEKQLNGGWIPVSERLPEKEDIYQVTIKYKNFAGIHLTVRTAIYENKKWNIHGPQPVISNIKIIAWQPLPEPYKEEER